MLYNKPVMGNYNCSIIENAYSPLDIFDKSNSSNSSKSSKSSKSSSSNYDIINIRDIQDTEIYDDVFYNDDEIKILIPKGTLFEYNVEYLCNCVYHINKCIINKENKILQCKKYVNNYKYYILKHTTGYTLDYTNEFIYLLNQIVVDIKRNKSIYNTYPGWVKKLIY